MEHDDAVYLEPITLDKEVAQNLMRVFYTAERLVEEKTASRKAGIIESGNYLYRRGFKDLAKELYHLAEQPENL